MEHSRINIERLERQDRIEKIVVITLLIIAICVAIYAFMNNSPKQMSSSEKNSNITNSENHSNTELANPQEKDTSETEMSEKEMDDSSETSNKEETVEDITGLLVVGLFANQDNADRMKAKLDELGFEGKMKQRADGKTMVGVKSSENDNETFSKIMNHFSEAVFIAD